MTGGSVGIVGGGVAGLHLALFLQQHGVPNVLYTERTPDELRNARLLNTVAHFAHTRERERALGVNHWDDSGVSYDCHYHYIGGEQPLVFRGDFSRPGLAVDHRVLLSRLQEDYEDRGGTIRLGSLTLEDVDRLGAEHDLVVVATGKAGLAGELFPRDDARSPYSEPQRVLSAGLYTGVAYPEETLGVSLGVSPGNGELIEIPIHTAAGNATALLFENVPGGDLEVLARASYPEDPAAFERLVLDKLRAHYPLVFERVDHASFALLGERDLLQGAVTPTVRSGWASLPSGALALAVGDAHVLVDPVIGQGSNAASYSAWQVGEAILDGGPYDERFCASVDERRCEFVWSAAALTNAMLQPPPPHVVGLLVAMAGNKSIADDFTENFNHPDRQLANLASPDATAAYIASF